MPGAPPAESPLGFAPMISLRRVLPLPPFERVKPGDLPWDLLAATAVVFLGVPQGMAYAIIAELPPAVGLFATALPAVVGSIFRSSRHVVAGPTNALSLLVGGAVVAASSGDALTVAVTLAVLVGLLQVAAGVLRLGAVVDFISSSVVLGYITGAGVLIGVGQLYNFVGTTGPRGRMWVTLEGWVATLPDAVPVAVGMAVGTIVLVLLLRRISRKVPSALVAMLAAIAVNLLFDLEQTGLKVVADVAPIPAGLPPLSWPDPSRFAELLPFAVACAVLSLIESNAVARSIAARTGQRLDASTEFVGQGLANLVAGFTSGYPVSGSLSRSALNEQAGGRTRLSGALSGVLMVLALLTLSPLLDHTPVACLAGLLVVVAVDLVDGPRIRVALRAGWPDRLAFLTTCLGTWALDLDKAIYLGVAVSLVLWLRKARLLSIREIVVGDDGVLKEAEWGVQSSRDPDRCPRIRMIQLQGSLFFAAAGELRGLLDDVTANPDVRCVILRVRGTRGLDATTAAVLEEAATKLRGEGRRLMLVGVVPEVMEVLRRTGALEVLGEDNVLPPGEHWFTSLGTALRAAVEQVGAHECSRCPLHPDGPFDPARSRPRVEHLLRG